MIEGVLIRELERHSDNRGWLAELFRSDELDDSLFPVMAYASLTHPGVARGPHEHREQTDYFCFVGPSTFKVYLWDRRDSALSSGEKMTLLAGADEPKVVIVPPGVVHAYKNIGKVPGLVFNAPNRLFMGPGKSEEVDEIRYEGVEDTPYVLD